MSLDYPSLRPQKLSYIAKSKIWGGAELIRRFGKKADGDNIGETWELSVRDDEMSIVENGEFASMTLREVINVLGNQVVSDKYCGDRFPLLIKFIDASDKLSVQVHPNDEYAERYENDLGKTEVWYIVSAEPDAKIVYGLAKGVSKEKFISAVEKGDIDSVMGYKPVKAGETYFIPSGMLHAIGKGIVIAEIQQNSDLTYRVYDYERRQSDGSLRELHVEKALDVTYPFSEAEIDAIRFEAKSDGEGDETIAHCRYFCVKHYAEKDEKKFRCESSSFHSLLCLGGEGSIETENGSYQIKAGDSFFIPAGLGDYSIVGDVELLLSSL